MKVEVTLIEAGAGIEVDQATWKASCEVAGEVDGNNPYVCDHLRNILAAIVTGSGARAVN